MVDENGRDFTQNPGIPSVLGMGLILLLGFFTDFRPVFFPNIGIYFHYQRTLAVETIQSIATWTRNPVLRPGFSFAVIGFEAPPLEALERLGFVSECATGSVESNTAYPSRTV
jgi:hypothetical protein